MSHPAPVDAGPLDDDLSVYEWPACGCCGNKLWQEEVEAGRLTCRPCEDSTAKRLRELPFLFRRLDTTAALMRGTTGGSGIVSGSRTPPIPPRPEVLNITAHGGAATRLSDIEDAWRKALGWTIAPWRGSPAQAVPEHIKFLTNNLPWACDSYDSIGQDVDAIRQLHNDCKNALNPAQRPGRVKTGLCPVVLDDGFRCDTQLTATTTKFSIRCGLCGTRWTGEEGWKELRRWQREAVAEDEGLAVDEEELAAA